MSQVLNPLVSLQCRLDCPVFPGGVLEQVRVGKTERPVSQPVAVPEHRRLAATDGDGSGRGQESTVFVVARRAEANPGPVRVLPGELKPADSKRAREPLKVGNAKPPAVHRRRDDLPADLAFTSQYIFLLHP